MIDYAVLSELMNDADSTRAFAPLQPGLWYQGLSGHLSCSSSDIKAFQAIFSASGAENSIQKTQ